MTKVYTINGQNVLTVENATDCYRVEYKGYDFGEGFNFDVEAVKRSVEENGLVYTACDYKVFAVVIKKLVK